MEETKKIILDLEDVKKLEPDFAQIKILTRDVCEKIQAIIFSKEKNILKILTTNNYPKPLRQIVYLLEEKGYRYEFYYTSPEGFNHAMTRYDQIDQQEERLVEEKRAERQAVGTGAIEMIKKLYEKRDTMDPGEFIMEIIKLAFQTGASDLHFQSENKGIVTKIRIDGVLQNILEFTHEDFRKYLQKIKFISGAKMNIDYMPEDGRFSFEANDVLGNSKSVDARTSFMPGILNESTVIRFLDSTGGIHKLEELGFQGINYDKIRKSLQKNNGIIILSGPTGSGKTTTLYSLLAYLNDGSKKIITLEDPIEYQIAGIQQSQINYSKGYTYEVGLKSVLRHDPDIILVGETRSLETAEISINAALTGHLVFTTLHTNSAIEGISRLLSMGIKPYMLAPAINTIIYQRLIRKVCPYCSSKKQATYAETEEIKQAVEAINMVSHTDAIQRNGEVPFAIGCDRCNGTGYLGRFCIAEVLEITDEIRNHVTEEQNTLGIYAKARSSGYLNIKEDGIMKLLEGKTTLEELRRVL